MALPDPAVGAKIPAAWGAAAILPVQDTSIGSSVGGFTVVSQVLNTALDGRLVTFALTITVTAGLTATAGNVTDTTVFTLASGYWPDFEVGAPFFGNVGGMAYVQTDGDIRLANASDSITAGQNITISATYLRGA
jgi:hypothetical protein